MAFSALGERLGRLTRRSRGGAPGQDADSAGEATPAGEARTTTVADRLPILRPASPFGIYLGLLFIVGGFTAIGITWGQVAGELQVALQLPYLASGGLTGLGLIIVGATLVNISVKRRDAAARNRRLERLASILEELREPSEGGEDR